MAAPGGSLIARGAGDQREFLVGYLIGTDEAGYGPNLGPLIVTVTVWRVPGDPSQADLYDLLRTGVSPSLPSKSRRGSGDASPDDGPRVTLADSKTLYKPPGGLAALELGLLTALGLLDFQPTCCREVWQRLASNGHDALAAIPWHGDYRCELPVAADRADLDRLIPRLQQVVADAGVNLLAVRSRAVFPERWNHLTEQHGTKGAVLSRLTLELLAEALTPLDDEPVLVICDKHGGRNYYAAMLQQFVTDQPVQVYAETRPESRYRWGQPPRQVEAVFRSKAERYLPAALASMASKYLRELAMRAFNQFWAQHVPQLRPTAGYPLDAGRFRTEIATAQAALGIADRVLWRNV